MTRGITQEYAGIFGMLQRIIDWTVLTSSGWLAYWLTFGGWAMPPQYINALLLGLLLSIIVFSEANLYRGWRGKNLNEELHAVLFSLGAVALLLTGIAFAIKLGGSFSRLWFGLWLILSASGLSLARIGIRSTLCQLRAQGFNQRRVVIVGCGTLSERVVHAIDDAPSAGLKMLGSFFDDDDACSVSPLPRLGGIQDVRGYVEEKSVDQVWLAMPLHAEGAIRKVLHDLRHSTADICFVPDIFGFNLLNHNVSEIAGVPVVNLTSSPMRGLNGVIKAVEDRLLALIILVLIMPLMLIIAAGVKLSSPGPVFFRQARHGWDGKPITVYKFRSMQVHQENSGKITQATRNDCRITPFGAFLRRTSLDELPQFINVLQGRMSIVGPRPHAIEHNEFYKDQVDRYMLRHKVKPGITGWAQVNGYRGETDTLYKMAKRVEYDLFYIENWSISFDLKIILLTLFRGFVNKNAY